MKKPSGWVYVEEGLPANSKTFEVSTLVGGFDDDEEPAPVVAQEFFSEREQVWFDAFGNEDDRVYAYRALPEPAPRRAVKEER